MFDPVEIAVERDFYRYGANIAQRRVSEALRGGSAGPAA
jgi:hypothetical protein